MSFIVAMSSMLARAVRRRHGACRRPNRGVHLALSVRASVWHACRLHCADRRPSATMDAMSRTLAAVALAAVALALTGCGSSDSGAAAAKTQTPTPVATVDDSQVEQG